ncbi:hypothetical protein SLA2020_459520 [Shorea laevis]
MAANNNNANSNSSTGTVVSNQTKPFAATWTQVVKPELIAVAPTSPSSSPSTPSTAVIEQAASASPVEEESVDNGSGTNDNAGKKPAWSRPSNGAAEVGSVMGTQWPALSESARVSSKSSPDSFKVLSDGSSLSSPVVSQGTGNASVSSQKHVNSNANSNSTPNHTVPARQRSMKRNNSGLSQPPPSPGSAVEASLSSPSSRDHARGGFISQSHSGNDHPQHRNSFRSRNGGPHPRGDGSHTQNYGGRRNQDHGNQDWNHHRNFNGRDAPMQSPRGAPRFLRHGQPPAPNPAPYMPPPPSWHFGNPMGFPAEFPSVYYVPAPTHPDPLSPPQVFFHPPDLRLHERIVNQIDYYFSSENLIKDTFLRQNMNDHGWVRIELIAGFKKVSSLTDKIPIILNALQSSTVVEVQGDKIRKRDDWKRWIMPSSVQIPNVSSPRFGENSSQDVLSAGIQNISLDQNVNNWSGSRNHAESSSGDLNDQLLSSSEGMAVSAQGGPLSCLLWQMVLPLHNLVCKLGNNFEKETR